MLVSVSICQWRQKSATRTCAPMALGKGSCPVVALLAKLDPMRLQQARAKPHNARRAAGGAAAAGENKSRTGRHNRVEGSFDACRRGSRAGLKEAATTISLLKVTLRPAGRARLRQPPPVLRNG